MIQEEKQMNGQGADLGVVKGLEWYAKAEEARAE